MTPEEKGAADGHIQLGNQHEDGGAFEDALSCYLDAIKAAPNYPRAHLNLASGFELVGRSGDAIDALQRALTFDPSYAPAYFNLGKLHASKRNYDDAERALRQVLRLDPTFVNAAIVLAEVFESQGKHDAAEVMLRDAATSGSGSAGAAVNLGVLLRAQGRVDEAEHAFAQALAIDPDFTPALAGMGSLWLHTRRARGAEPMFRRALSLDVGRWDVSSTFLFSLNVRDDLSPSQIHDEHLRVAKTLESHAPQSRTFKPIASIRKLRIGYVSGDFGHHPIGLFMRPVLANHDRNVFEVYCYCNNDQEVDLTRRLKASSDHWRDITLLSDDQAASLIRSDQIDILVDLSGYTSGSRLAIFTRRPAPVQVSWMGYLNTTGLQSIGYRITDRFADPRGSEPLYSEQLYRLPHSQWCYQPVYELPLSTIPNVAEAPLVFGCFNQFAKISDSCLALWCEILNAVPRSRLLVLGVPGKTAEKNFREDIASLGVEPHRIDIRGRVGIREYFDAISSVAVALDTFPYNGATTTLDTLWMGVPVVALPGSTAVARSSFSIMSSLGAAELIATSPSDLIARNVALALDSDFLGTLRLSLRSRLAQSPLMDARGFTRGLEEGFRFMAERANLNAAAPR